MKYSGLETIVWDLDGTLLNSFGIYCEVLGEAVSGRGISLPGIDVLTANFHGSLEDSIQNALPQISSSEIAKIYQRFLGIQDRHYEVVEHNLFEDALSLAKKAQQAGLQQIIVTNRDHEGRLNASPRSIVANSSLRNLIDSIICGDDGPHRKPLIEVFDGNAPDGATTLVIGDQFVDVQLAYNLGARALIVDRGSATLHEREQLHDDWRSHTEVVSSLDDVVFG